MTEIDIRKDRFTTREESGSWGHVANWYNQSKEISRVNIDTTHGDIDVYIDGKPVAPRQNPKPKPKLWNVKVPHAEKTLYRKHDSGALFASIYVGPQNHANDFLFTDSEIIKYGLQDCEKTEVPNED